MTRLVIPARQDFPELHMHREIMNGKRVYEIEAKTVVNFKSEFGEKLLSDGYTFSLGSACVFNCAFCYVQSVWRKHSQICRILKRLKPHGIGFEDIVIRRSNALDILREQLTIHKPGSVDLSARSVIFTSPFVDPAANMELVHETVAACRIIFELTNWDIRILSKSSLLKNLAEEIPAKFRNRVIFGLSTGTLDDKLARSFEQGTALVSQRLKALHWLQDNGFRTFGMICPSLPQDNYDKFAADMAKREKLAESDVAILPPSILRALLKDADEEAALWISLAAFTGMRTAELLRLHWQHLDFEAGVIRLPRQVTKTGAKRQIPILPNLRAWLEPFTHRTGLVFASEKAHDRTIAYAKGRGIEWPTNWARHSFGTYRATLTKGVGQVSIEMGNSEGIVKRHYFDQHASEKDAHEWFSIVPEHPTHLIAMKGAIS